MARSSDFAPFSNSRGIREMTKGSVVLVFCAALCTSELAQQAPPPPRAGLTLTAAEFGDGETIPVKFTATTKNPVSPKLEWKNILPNAVSFALIVHDPDTSRNKTTEDVLHWMMVNLPADAREIAEGVG